MRKGTSEQAPMFRRVPSRTDMVKVTEQATQRRNAGDIAVLEEDDDVPETLIFLLFNTPGIPAGYGGHGGRNSSNRHTIEDGHIKQEPSTGDNKQYFW